MFLRVWSRRAWLLAWFKGEAFAVDASVIEANAGRYHGKAPNELDWSDAQRQQCAVAEYLASLDAEARARADDTNDTDDGSAGESEQRINRKPPKAISPSDPQSAWTAKANKRVLFGYGLNYMIDVKHAVIVDVEATPARTYDEVSATKTMIERTERRFDMNPKRLAADTAYGIDRFLGWLVKKRIMPRIPVWNMSKRKDGTFFHADFTFDKKRNIYICPAGKTLTHHRQLQHRPGSPVHRVRTRLSVMHAQAAMLPEHALTPDRALRERGCPRPGAPQDEDQSVL
jgi:hypothetical protein